MHKSGIMKADERQEMNWEMWIEKRLRVKNRYHSWIAEAIQMEYIQIGHNKELCGSFAPQVTACQNYKFQRNIDQKPMLNCRRNIPQGPGNPRFVKLITTERNSSRKQKPKRDENLLPFSFLSLTAHFLPAQFYDQNMEIHPKLPFPNLPSGRAA